MADLQSLILSKKRFRHRCFLVNFAKFLITHFLKNPSDGSFYINTHSVNCSTKTLVLPPPPLFMWGNKFLLPPPPTGGGGESEKLKKGGGSMVQGLLKTRGELTLFLFNFFKICHFYI